MSTQRGHFPYLVSMKYLILPLILIPTIAHAQKGIQTENGRKLYLGTNNRLEVGAEKTKPGSIELSTDNGKIIKRHDSPWNLYHAACPYWQSKRTDQSMADKECSTQR
jgi:hypothetical protein